LDGRWPPHRLALTRAAVLPRRRSTTASQGSPCFSRCAPQASRVRRSGCPAPAPAAPAAHPSLAESPIRGRSPSLLVPSWGDRRRPRREARTLQGHPMRRRRQLKSRNLCCPNREAAEKGGCQRAISGRRTHLEVNGRPRKTLGFLGFNGPISGWRAGSRRVYWRNCRQTLFCNVWPAPGPQGENGAW
jgi:hypothetical protein